jgi:putative hydrolase of the HAD superfamily
MSADPPALGGRVPIEGGRVPIEGGRVPIEGGRVPIEGGRVPIEAIVSDFGGVLTSPLTDSFVGVLDSSGVSLAELGKAMMAIADREGSNPLFELETGRLSEATFMGRLSEQLSAQLGSTVELDEFGERYFRRLQPNERLIEYMRRLRGRGYKMAICTNNVREWETLWRAMLPVDEIFDVVVDSAFVGSRKPEARIYEITLERLGASPQATLFIDDVEANCEGARQLGMYAIRFRSTDQAIEAIEAALRATG